MNTPNPALMKQYGTGAVFKEKTANNLPLLSRMGMALLNYQLSESGHQADREQVEEQNLKALALLELERQRMSQATQALRHTPVPLMVAAGSDLPPGYDEGMVRLASVAVSVGSLLAKKAAPSLDVVDAGKKYLLGNKSLVRNVATGALAVGGLAAAQKGFNAASTAMQKEPRLYGTGRIRSNVGYQMPYGVNEYGAPQVGTPLF